jgi:hypothetical protein
MGYDRPKLISRWAPPLVLVILCGVVWASETPKHSDKTKARNIRNTGEVQILIGNNGCNESIQVEQDGPLTVIENIVFMKNEDLRSRNEEVGGKYRPYFIPRYGGTVATITWTLM